MCQDHYGSWTVSHSCRRHCGKKKPHKMMVEVEEWLYVSGMCHMDYNLLLPKSFSCGLQVFPPILFQGPPHNSSILIQGTAGHLLLVDSSDLFYIFWIQVRELCDQSGLGIDQQFMWIRSVRCHRHGRLARLSLNSFFIFAKSNSSHTIVNLIFLLILSIHMTLILSYPYIFTIISSRPLSSFQMCWLFL